MVKSTHPLPYSMPYRVHTVNTTTYCGFHILIPENSERVLTSVVTTRLVMRAYNYF